MLNSFNLAAGQLIEFNEPGDFFRILAASAPVTVRYYNKGREISEAEGVGAGYAEQFKADTFDRLTIYSASAQAMQVVSRLGSVVSYEAPPVGNVSVVNTPTVRAAGLDMTQVNFSVAPLVGSQVVLPANTARQYLCVQNSGSAPMWLNVTGGAAAAVNGIRLAAGERFEFRSAPTEQVSALVEGESNQPLVILWG